MSAPQQQTVSINFAGDIALFRDFEERGVDPLAMIQLPAADYSIANFEFIQPRPGRSKRHYAVDDRFHCSYDWFSRLRLSRFDAYGLANNHALDYGRAGAEDVIAQLDQQGIASFGISASGDDSVLRISIGDIRFAVIAGVSSGHWDKALHGFGPEALDMERLEQLIVAEKAQCDHVLVFLHWGSELVDIPPPQSVLQARRLIDLGASAVIGHHPHVPQGIQQYSQGCIAYSLGSFIYLPDRMADAEPGHPERELSIVLRLEFSKHALTDSQAYYYRYNPASLLPEICDTAQIEEYIHDINSNVENARAYTRRLRSKLLRRELLLMRQRFRLAPLAALRHYLGYIRLRHVRKLCGI